MREMVYIRAVQFGGWQASDMRPVQRKNGTFNLFHFN